MTSSTLRKPWPLLVLATGSQAATSILQQGIAVIAVLIAAAYHLSLLDAGLLVTAATFGGGIGFGINASIVDRMGPRRLLFWGTAGSAFVAILIAELHTYGGLLLALFVLGIVLASAPSAGTKAVFMAFHGRARGLPMGIRQTGVPVGAALAAFFLPRLAAHLGAQTLFFGMGLLLLVVSWSFAAVIPAASRTVEAARQMEWKRARPLVLPAFLMMLMVSGQYVVLTFSIPYLHNVLGLSLAIAGSVLALSQLGGGVGRIVLGYVSDRMGSRSLVVFVAGFLDIVLIVLVGWLPHSVPAWLLAVLWTGLGVGALGWNAVLVTWSGERVDPDLSGMAMSFTGMAAFFGAAIYPPIFGWLVDRTHSYHWAWMSMVPFLLGALLLVIKAYREERRTSGLEGGAATASS